MGREEDVRDDGESGVTGRDEDVKEWLGGRKMLGVMGREGDDTSEEEEE